MTPDFGGYVCWTASKVQDTIPVDAVDTSTAVFMATHEPSPIIRRPIGAATGGRRVTEGEVRDAFLTSNSDMVLMPIVGQAGTGKSHFIRWLHAAIPEGATREVIYVPKYNTSLRRVIDLIVDKMEGPDKEALRESLRDAFEGLAENEAPAALLDALARVIEFRSITRPHAIDAEREEWEWLLERLPVLVRDGVFRRHFLRTGGVVDGFVQKILRGSRPGDQDDAFAFSADDLPLSMPDLKDAGRYARDIHGQISSDGELRRLAAEVLSEHLGPAVREVFGLASSVGLDTLMRQTRQALLKRGKELVILFEDFRVLQGIQRELLDALIAPPSPEGKPDLCGVRVALAVTSGYFDSLEDTIRTRAEWASDKYVLDVPYEGSQGWRASQVAGFVARYLNAARVGRDALETASARGEETPNACDVCPFVQRCHEGFGSAHGFGLYPFNRSALDRAVQATVTADYFDPRRVLGNVVRYTLDEHADAIRTGRFPSETFDLAFRVGQRNLKPLGFTVRDELERFAEPERRAVLLTFWGGCPDEVVDLSAGIHQAFQLAPTGEATVKPRPSNEPPTQPTPGTAPPPQLPERVTAALAELDQWLAGTMQLGQSTARLMRTALHAGVWARVEPGDRFMYPATYNAVFDQYSVEIAETLSRRRSSAKVVVSVSRDIASANVLRGVLLADHYGNWSFDSGMRLYSHYANWCDAAATMVGRALDQWRQETVIGPGIAALAMSARLYGQEGSGGSDGVRLLVAALRSIDVLPGSLDGGWDRLLFRITAQRQDTLHEVFQVATGRQGTGTPQVVDFAVLSHCLAAFTAGWELPSGEDAHPSIRRYLREIDSAIKVDLPATLQYLGRAVTAAASYFVGASSAREVAERVSAAYEEAAAANVLHAPDKLTVYRQWCKDFEQVDLSEVASIREILALDQVADRKTLFVRLGRMRLQLLERALVFGKNSVDVLTATQRNARAVSERDAASSENVVSGMEGILGTLAAGLTEILRNA